MNFMTHGRKIWLSYRVKAYLLGSMISRLHDFGSACSLVQNCTVTSFIVLLNFQRETFLFWNFNRCYWYHIDRGGSRNERGRNAQLHMVDDVWKSPNLRRRWGARGIPIPA
jgi:hypothetical protein